MHTRPWDQEPDPNDVARRLAARERARSANFHQVLTEVEKHARMHEALKRMAEVLVETTQNFLDVLQKDAKASEEDARAMQDEREYHLEKIITILTREAIERTLR